MNWASYILIAINIINLGYSTYEAGKTGKASKFWGALIATAITGTLYYFAGVFG